MRVILFCALIAAAVTVSYVFQHDPFVFAITGGVLSGLIASFVLILSLAFIRPKLKISPNIAKGVMASGQDKLTIKVVNQSLSAVIEPRAELHALKRNQGGIMLSRKIRIVNESPMVIMGSLNKKKRYFRFVAPIDGSVEDTLKKYPDGLRFRIRAEHPTSNVKRIFSREYQPSDILNGVFSAGAEFKIDEAAPDPNEYSED